MSYISINVHYIERFWPSSSESGYTRTAQINGIWFSYNKYGEWIMDDTYQTLTEKSNAMINYNIKTVFPVSYNRKPLQPYNITKYLLLKQIINNHLITDILPLIIQLSE